MTFTYVFFQALEVDANNTDALVARGAAYANLKRFEEAAADFERALQIKPSHENARQYLSAIQQKVRCECEV